MHTCFHHQMPLPGRAVEFEASELAAGVEESAGLFAEPADIQLLAAFFSRCCTAPKRVQLCAQTAGPHLSFTGSTVTQGSSANCHLSIRAADSLAHAAAAHNAGRLVAALSLPSYLLLVQEGPKQEVSERQAP